MKVRFWGTRGSLAKPGVHTLRYGGNTACVEVRSARGTLIVLDCGTGVHDLGRKLVAESEGAIRGALLISHLHWDHIQGFPFFAPLFGRENEWDIYAPRGLNQSLRDALAGQMEYPYFPVDFDVLGATTRFHELVEGTVRIGDVRVRTRYLDHPALTLGYRVEADGRSLVYACDHESAAREPVPSQRELASREAGHVEFLRDADLVIHDAQYTVSEYPDRIGWGHATPSYAAAVCRAACARQLALTHHDPVRDDDAVDRIVRDTRAEVERWNCDLTVFGAAEGNEIDLGGRPLDPDSAGPAGFAASAEIDNAVLDHSIFLGAVRPAAAKVLREAAEQENLLVTTSASAEAAIREGAGEPPSLVLLDADAAPRQSRAVLEALGRVRADGAPSPSAIVIANRQDAALKTGSVDVDWVTWPFSEAYARAKLRAGVLRGKCRWVRAGLPDDEGPRLGALRQLGILDTAPEERFDRITRIASGAFDVPIALVTLMDRERQWFKSCIGLDARETAREMAFCAHAILQRETLIVPDALLDNRFADNPLVTSDPHIRFYASCPLRPYGDLAVGTLCLIDTRARNLSERQVEVLADLARLVETELRNGAEA